MAKKICFISHLHLSTNPRVWKAANFLAQQGFDISILTTVTLESKFKDDLSFIHHNHIQYKPVLNLIHTKGNFFNRNYYRVKRKLLEIAKLKFNYEHPDFIILSQKKYIKAAMAEQADLYVGHAEGGLLVGVSLLGYNKKVAFDIEDWYSNDFINASRPIKMLQQYENKALHRGVFVTCPSESMAKALQHQANTNKQVHVIYNGFSVLENKSILPKQFSEKPQLVWFSQTVGRGRGLETLVESLHHVATPVHVKLIGNCVKGYDEELKKNFPFHKNHSIEFIKPVHHSKLLSEIAKCDIGLAIENNFPANKDTTISNKILQYLQANLLVLATNTQGQKEVYKQANTVVVMALINNVNEWANKIEQLITQINITNNTAQQIFNKEFSWEIQEKKMLQLVNKAII